MTVSAVKKIEGKETAADREKRVVALSSVIAAVFLTGMKLVVGIATGSLGILSEAAHSALDLVAAAATMIAVRISGRPADSDHTYGHGKIENLSALFETVLLLATCVWIIYEAIQRLFFKNVEVETTIWSFVIMAGSIVIDFTRSRALSRVAKKYHSQALEADALHFSTDIWSSSVVILGLFLVLLSRTFSLPGLAKADSIAAVGVAAIVVYVSIRLGRRTITALLDGIPAGMLEDVEYVAKVPGVTEVKRARVRISGPETFVDIVLAVAPRTPVEIAHRIASQARESVRAILPSADVVVQVDPGRVETGGLLETVRWMASHYGMGVHSVHLYDAADSRLLDLHLEVDEHLRVDEAHTLAAAFEESLHAVLPNLEEIVTHLEPAGDATAARPASSEDETRLLQTIREVAESLCLECEPHQVKLRRVEGELALTFHLLLSPSTTIRDAHTLTEKFERSLRKRAPDLNRVVIHVEPKGSDPE
jgi:cation diffusion facilitator family transporter